MGGHVLHAPVAGTRRAAGQLLLPHPRRAAPGGGCQERAVAPCASHVEVVPLAAGEGLGGRS
eukprot:7772791-Lingulodinium_polyedra.AAC.1